MNFDYYFAPEKVVTPDFVIRTYRPGDGQLLNEAVNNSYEHLRTFMAWAKPHTPLEDSEALCRKCYAYYLTNIDYVLGIFSPDETRLLGGSGFHLRGTKLAERSAEIGMWIRGDTANTGLGTAVLRALLTWGFEEWPWLRLVWKCDSTNFASARVAEKAGLLQEGVERGMYNPGQAEQRRDLLVFSILRDEWEKSRA